MIEYLAESNVVHLGGEFLFSNATECLKELEAIKDHLYEQITLDCSQVKKADSSFLAILIEVRRWAHQKRWPFAIKQLPSFLKSFLSVYGIEELLTTALIDASMSAAQFTVKGQ